MGPRLGLWLLLLPAALLLHEERGRAAAKVSPRPARPAPRAPRGLFVHPPALRCAFAAGPRGGPLWAAIAHPRPSLLCYGPARRVREALPARGEGRSLARQSRGARVPGRRRRDSNPRPRRAAPQLGAFTCSGRASGSGLDTRPPARRRAPHACARSRFVWACSSCLWTLVAEAERPWALCLEVAVSAFPRLCVAGGPRESSSSCVHLVYQVGVLPALLSLV